MKSLNELLDSLTEDEKVLHADLIAETIQRDREIKENSRKSHEGLAMIEKNLMELADLFRQYDDAMQQCQIELQKLRFSLENLSGALTLGNIPEDKFEIV